MKKYLITAAMAVAVSGALVSCHDDEITGSTVEQKIQAFEDVFAQAFGKPDPNHTWGFGKPIEVEGEEALTRSVDINGNLWVNPPGPVSDLEKNAIYNYVNKVRTSIEHYSTESPINLTNFFVTHIWKGESSDPNCNYKNYASGDVYGPGQMDYLHISTSNARLSTGNNGTDKLNNTWDHVNDFNSGQSTDYDGSTMFVNWGTQNFAYYNSNDSKFHDKWIIIDGQYIRDANGNNYPNKYYVCFDFVSVASVKTIIGLKVPGINYATSGEMTEVDGSGVVRIEGYYTSIDEIPYDQRRFIYNGKTYIIGTGENYEWYIKDHDGNTNMSVDANEYYTDWIIRLVPAQAKPGVFPKVKIPTTGTTTDGYYKRKIISGEQVLKSGRVFCEDIVSSQSKYRFEDLDYNDVVFDAATIHNYKRLETTYYDKDQNFDTSISPNPVVTYEFTEGNDVGCDEYYTIIRVLAGGGTLPIEIKVGEPGAYQTNSDLHELFDGTSPSTMINTLTDAERWRVSMAKVVSGMAAVDLEKNNTTETGDAKKKFYGITDIDKKIELNVNYGNVATTIKSKYYENDPRGESELVASAKIMVPLGTPWPKERVNINRAYPQFNDWVSDECDDFNNTIHKFWLSPAHQDSLYIDNAVVGLDPVIYAKDNFIKTENGEVVVNQNGEEEIVLDNDFMPITSTGSSELLDVDPTNPYVPVPEGTVLYDYLQTEGPGPGYLYENHPVTIPSSTTGFNNIAVGKVLRVYGVYYGDFEVAANCNTAVTATDFAKDRCGYIDIPIITALGTSDLTISGKNFTITYVSVVNGNIWTSNAPEGTAVGYGNEVYVSGDKFRDANANSTIRVNCTATSGWQIIAKDGYGNQIKQFGNWEETTIDSGYLEFVIGNQFIDNVKNSGLLIHGASAKVKSIQLK